jgi:general secretion pathway protein A
MSIYLNHFGLNSEPFSIVPDPGFLYPSNHHRQAVAHLKYGLDREGGFILLSGEVGTGKTTLTRTILKRLPAHVRVAYVLNSKLQVTDVLASICHELSIDIPKTADLSFAKTCIDALNQNLIEAHAEGKKTLVVIEEAQNLSAEVLETLRLLSNLETTTHKLLHILLVGQPELLEILAQKEQRQLNQRVVSRFHLLPLEQIELTNYVNHRLHCAGASRDIFDNAAMAALFRLTKGVPRLINLICHHSLLAAYATGKKTVAASLVKQAAKEILGEQPAVAKTSIRWAWVGLIVLATLSVGVFLDSYKLRNDNVLSQIPNQPPDSQTVIAQDSRQQQLSAQENPSLEDNLPVAVAEIAQPSLELTASQSPVAVVETAQPSVELTATQSPLANPFAALFALWSVDTEALLSEEEVAAQAAYHGLQVEKLSTANWGSIRTIDRPGIVWLEDTAGVLKTYLLDHVNDNYLSLVGMSGPQTMEIEVFLQAWNGVFLYLWQPSPEIDSLRLDDKNSRALSWLQDRFQKADSSYQQIITGGRYNWAIREQVFLFQNRHGINADGVVGPQTIMKLNQLTDPSIPRLINPQADREVD